MVFDDNQPTRRIIAFVTTENLRNLANADIFFCDGTFYTCPNLFYQIYSIHIPIDDVMTPVIHAFLPGNSQATYTRFFTLIKDKIADLGLVFSPTSTMEDFETAVHNSIREVFPDINTNRCFSPLHPEYMEKITGNRTLNTIPRQRRRQDFGSTSGNSTAYTSCIS